MYTVFDANHFGVTATFEEIVPLLRKYGITGIQVPTPFLLDPEKGAEAAKLLRDNGLRWSLLPTPSDFYAEDVTDDAFDKALETLRHWADAGERMGVRHSCNHVWNGSHVREYQENFEWLSVRIRRVWRVLNDSGIRYGLEFLGPVPLRDSFRYPFFHTLSGILALADSVDKSCGFVFDTYHWYTGSDQEQGDLYLAAQQVNRMVNFHVNDGLPGRTREQQQDLERSLPLENGIIDAAAPYALFQKAGYAGPVMCEPMRPLSANAAGRSLEEIVKLVAQAYRRLSEAGESRTAGAWE